MTVLGAGPEHFAAIVVAGGSSTRFGGSNKLFSVVDGRPLICSTLENMCQAPIRRLVLVCREQDRTRMERCLPRVVLPHRVRILLANGGSTRFESVAKGLTALLEDGAADGDWVLIHDGDRPAVSRALLRRLVSARETGAVVIPVVPLSDSLRRVSAEGSEIVDRTGIAAVQTPQLCKVGVLRDAFAVVPRDTVFTDEAAVIQSCDGKVAVVQGDAANIKVTVPSDLRAVRRVIEKGARTIVGFGYDVHRFEVGRRLVLGGVAIPSEVGLLGTSDADAVLHALMDAILGCAGAGDIGGMFPSSDAQYAGIDSRTLVERVMRDKRVRRLRVLTVDVTIVAERPRLSGYQEAMRKSIAQLLRVPARSVDVKVTGNDSIGWIGRGEGIAALCVVSAVRHF